MSKIHASDKLEQIRGYLNTNHNLRLDNHVKVEFTCKNDKELRAKYQELKEIYQDHEQSLYCGLFADYRTLYNDIEHIQHGYMIIGQGRATLHIW